MLCMAMRRHRSSACTAPSIVLLIVLLAAVIVIGTEDRRHRSVNTNKTDGRKSSKGGNVGCLLSQKLCRKQEFCFDDFAFGRCLLRRSKNGEDESTVASDDERRYRFSLDKDALRQLEREFRRLFLAGYRWAHSYTQCIVKRLLDSFRRRSSSSSPSPFERGQCDGKEDDDLARALQFLEAEHKVDPKDLAIIRFQPSLDDPHPDYGDEMYAPGGGRGGRMHDDVEDVLGGDDVGVIQTYIDVDGELSPTRSAERKFKRQKWTVDDNEDVDEDGNVRLSDRQLEELRSLIATQIDDDPRVELLRELEYDPVRRDQKKQQQRRGNADDSWSFARHKGNGGGSSDAVQSIDVDDLFEAALKKSYDGDESDLIDVRDDEDEEERDRQLLYLSGLLRLDPTVAFERPHRYDVKKPGPYFKVNNYVFEKMKKEEEKDDGKGDAVLFEEPLIFKQHPMFEDNNPAQVTFRHHHLAEEAEAQPQQTSQIDANIGSASGTKSLKRVDLQDYASFFDSYPAMDDPSIDYSLPSIDYDQDRITNENLSPGDVIALGDYLNQVDNSEPFIEDYEPMKSPYIYSGSFFSERQQMKANNFNHGNLNNKMPINGDKIFRQDVIENPSAGALVVSKNVESVPVHTDEQAVWINRVSSNDHIDPSPKVESRRIKPSADPSQFDVVDTSCVYLVVDKGFKDWPDGDRFVRTLESLMGLSFGTFTNVRQSSNGVMFKVNSKEVNGSVVANKAEAFKDKLFLKTGILLTSAGIGDKSQLAVEALDDENGNRMFIVTFVVCGVIAGAVIAVGALYVVRRHARSREKLQNIAQLDNEASHDYQDLCRQRMASKNSEKPEPIHVAQRVMSRESETSVRSPSSRSSTSSWNEEPVLSNMDISTGHMVLSYMEDHLNNKDRLEQEWIALCAYEADSASTEAASDPANIQKNRYGNILPYDHSRVILNDVTNIAGSDYVNASTITDHDPRNPAYVACQGPLPHTSADFWQMVWEQGSVVIVMLTRLVENGVAMCHRYWPEEGSELYHIYEVHLVSEHIWCEDYLVRSFYLKNLKTGETRTVTQFHFLSWPDNGVPNATKALLDYRRKVNKSYRGRSCPIVVHCSDGIGRTGTYCLIDMVLNRMAKGAKEIDIAATLEHIRDQRTGMVRTKAQFEFALMAVAEEVHAILKALPQ